MRKTLWRTTLGSAVVLLISAVSVPGCSTSSGFKMPESTWFSWGKKKPDNTALASKPTTGLPAPPSTLTSPNTAPSYVPGTGGTSTYANNQYRGTPAGGTTPGAAAYGSQPGGANYYSAASYGTAAGANRGVGSANQAYGGTGSSQGFYSPDYRGAPTPAAGGTSAYARPSAPASYPAESGGYPAGSGGDAYGSYNQSGRVATPSAASQPWGQPAATSATPYAGTAGSSYGGAAAYGQTPATNAAPAYDASGANRGTTGYAGSTGAYSGSTYGGSLYGNAQPAAPQASGQDSLSPVVAAGGYRPGSTGRNTQFGTSDNLSVPSGEAVQPASFAGAGQAAGGSSLSAPSPIGGNAQNPDGGSSPAQTATGGSNTYPSTYQR
ncbi:MAG: hypothetical protein GX575_13290 [Candidatus Anammoximicrobium sp.]|mgnify:CR=1 FL=1|nr:hypothetical protein [Candidatus Anammoximicrobium sp.]